MCQKVVRSWLALALMVLVPTMVLASTAGTMTKTSEPSKVEKSVKVGTTLENLMAAYNGESNAQAKYQAFALQADKEGYLKVGKLFRALAMSEGIHAAKHAKVIESMNNKPKATIETHKVGNTKENLAAALSAENHEVEAMYPAFIQKAEQDKNSAASRSFAGAKGIESIHVKLLSAATADLKSWKTAADFYVCKICGNTVAALDFQYCPICKAPLSEFVKVQ
jgi:rubrerythrin